MSLTPAQQKMMLEQYRRCYEEYNKYNEMAWQVPSVGMTITGILLGVAYEFLPHVPRLGLILLNTLFIWALTIIFVKHRLNVDDRTEFLRQIEASLKVPRVPMETDEIIKYVEDRRALESVGPIIRFTKKRSLKEEHIVGCSPV